MIDKTILNKNAHKNPSTLKPGTIEAASRINKPLITKVNNPKVSKLMGRVKSKITGFKDALIIPRTSATIKAANIPET